MEITKEELEKLMEISAVFRITSHMIMGSVNDRLDAVKMLKKAEAGFDEFMDQDKFAEAYDDNPHDPAPVKAEQVEDFAKIMEDVAKPFKLHLVKDEEDSNES